MKILLTGATGFIGHHIKNALEAEHELITPTHHDVDFNMAINPEDWMHLLKNVDTVINSVGIIAEVKGQTFSRLHQDAPTALFKASEQSGVKRIIQISALGADENAFTPYQATKYAAEKALKKHGLKSFVLRPSLVYGEGAASFKMFKFLASLPIMTLPDGGKQKVQPVHVSDLVVTVKQCLIASDSQTIDVVGPQAMTLVNYIQAIRSSLGKKKRALVIPIPMKFIMLSAQLGRFIIPMMHPDNMRMLQHGNTADISPLVNFIGRNPLSLEEGLNQ